MPLIPVYYVKDLNSQNASSKGYIVNKFPCGLFSQVDQLEGFVSLAPYSSVFLIQIIYHNTERVLAVILSPWYACFILLLIVSPCPVSLNL